MSTLESFLLDNLLFCLLDLTILSMILRQYIDKFFIFFKIFL